MTPTMAKATTIEMQNLLGQGYGAIQQQLEELKAGIMEDFNVLTRRSAAIEEKLDSVTEALDGLTTALAIISGKVERNGIVLASLERRTPPAVAMPEVPRRFGRRPAKKKRGRNGR